MYDIIIAGGTVIDGKRAPRHRGDVGIQGDRIAAIGDLAGADAAQVIDAAGRTVAPGFIDVHNHSDGWFLRKQHLVSKTSQGFTSEVIMADGISYAPVSRQTAHEWLYYMRGLNALRMEDYTGWETLADYMALLDRNNVQNAIMQIPYANVRTLICGWGPGPADDLQMKLIQLQVEQGMEEGACGLSTGLDYAAQCFASTAELAAACLPMAEAQAPYVTHMRYKIGTLAALQEAVEIGRRAGVPVHISHLKAANEADTEAILSYVDQVAVHEVDFSFDVYPYLPGSTLLNYLLPYQIWHDGPLDALPKLRDPAMRAQVDIGLEIYASNLDAIRIAWLPGKENSVYLGMTLAEYVDEVGKSPVDALCDLLIEENLAVLLVFFQGDDRFVEPFLAHKCYMMGTDGVFHEDSVIHPRQYGSAARLLGPCVRKGLFSLEDAVWKLSGAAAARFGLKDRGTIEEGGYADLVVFDQETIQDHATYVEPHRLAGGVSDVFVNGVPVILDSSPVETLQQPLPGRALRFNQ
ncbi:MAG: amidohydrolase family protein [Caldilineaceae bacterium SB0670_bin_27]|uniref:Amidohydrolase family protein n=1 Tax=Caldilineaceae bacterium SB0664_bin_27 TaxID=2605260 RepID=A0A6B0YQ81_9CHLR|nr:amidohydrolase family protein [Caldilineaceae bacterium SB0664_bin_27]MYJ78904.1 amidohydrolase family protein [Caldilineaceae bacterium SB0670_bin_27]